jgi:hypothetical protein
MFPQSGYEMAEVCEAPHESLNVLNVSDMSHVGNRRDLIKVRFDSTLSDDVHMELVPRDFEGAFL